MPNKSKYTIESITNGLPSECRLSPIRFTDTRYKPSGQKYMMVLCKCKCGNEIEINAYHLVDGSSLSCGCLRDERTRKANTKYFPVIEDIYSSWLSMIRRCYNKKYEYYKYYGGKGVKVCEEWKNNYQSFLDWSLVNGWQEGYEIDKDIKGSGFLYSPESCLWVTKKENNDTKINSIRNIGAYKNGILVYTFFDIKEGIKTIGGKPCSYTQVLKGKRKTLFGYELKILKND